MNKYTALLALSALVSFSSKAMEQVHLKSLAEETTAGTTETEGSESSPAPFSREATPYNPTVKWNTATQSSLKTESKAIQTDPICMMVQLGSIHKNPFVI